MSPGNWTMAPTANAPSRRGKRVFVMKSLLEKTRYLCVTQIRGFFPFCFMVNDYISSHGLPFSNIGNLFHYVVYVTPNPANFSRKPTTIFSNGVPYEFEGFSLFLHRELPKCFSQTPINQWSTDFSLQLVTEAAPEVFYLIKDICTDVSYSNENSRQKLDIWIKIQIYLLNFWEKINKNWSF